VIKLHESVAPTQLPLFWSQNKLPEQLMYARTPKEQRTNSVHPRHDWKSPSPSFEQDVIQPGPVVYHSVTPATKT